MKLSSETIQTILGVIAGLAPVFGKLLHGQSKNRRSLEKKLDALIDKVESAIRLSNDTAIRVLHLEQKYAGLKVGETVIPEDTEERQEMRERAKAITGSFQPARPPKKTS